MQPARFRQEDILLVEINNAKVHESSREVRGRSAGSFPEQRLVIEPNGAGEREKRTDKRLYSKQHDLI